VGAQVLKESDLDGSQDIGPSEFTKIMSRVPDFARYVPSAVVVSLMADSTYSKFRITL
jgi:hypothetical protein